jgi:hypothetical protein
MNEMGLSDYCEDIHCLSVEKLVHRFSQLEQDAEMLKNLIKEKVAKQSEALERQYEIIVRENCPVQRTVLEQELTTTRS